MEASGTKVDIRSVCTWVKFLLFTRTLSERVKTHKMSVRLAIAALCVVAFAQAGVITLSDLLLIRKSQRSTFSSWPRWTTRAALMCSSCLISPMCRYCSRHVHPGVAEDPYMLFCRVKWPTTLASAPGRTSSRSSIST